MIRLVGGHEPLAFRAGTLLGAVGAAQSRRFVPFENLLGFHGAELHRPTAQHVLNIVEIVGRFLQEQPAGDAFVPVPGMVITAAVWDVVIRLDMLYLADLPAVDNSLGFPDDARCAQRERDHRLSRGRLARGGQGAQILYRGGYRLFEKQRDIPAQHLHGIRGMRIAPRADHASVQLLAVQHLPRGFVIPNGFGMQTGMRHPGPGRSFVQIRKSYNLHIQLQLQQHVLDEIARPAAVANHADFQHTDPSFSRLRGSRPRCRLPG